MGACVGKVGAAVLVPETEVNEADMKERSAKADESGEAAAFGNLSLEEKEKIFAMVAKHPRTNDVDGATKLFMGIVKLQYEKFNAEPRNTFEDIKIDEKKTILKFSLPNQIGGIKLSRDDEDFAAVPWIATKILEHGMDLPNEDLETYFSSKAEALALHNAVLSRYAPRPNVVWDELSSDTSIERFIFHGLGQLWIASAKRVLDAETLCKDAAFCVDLRHYGNFEARKGLERPGAAAFFDRNRKIVGIYWCHGKTMVRPQDGKRWEHAKFAFKSTCLHQSQVFEHLAHVHYSVSNAVSIAARETLSRDHPLRRFLRPFTYRTNGINSRTVSTLASDGAFFHRLSGLKHDTFLKVLDRALASFTYASFDQQIASRKLDAETEKLCPWFSDGRKLNAILRRFVRGYLDVFYDSDTKLLADNDVMAYWSAVENARQPKYRFGLGSLSLQALEDQLTHFLFHVTAVHEFVGSQIEYLTLLDGLGSRIYPGQTEIDIQSYIQGITLASFTGICMPSLMDVPEGEPGFRKSWKHLYLDDRRERVETVHDKFMADLRGLSKEIDRLNKDRPTFQACNPKFLECSVSL